MPGFTCQRHDRYVHDGEACPYCEPEPQARTPVAFEVPFAVADRTKLSLTYLAIEPGDTLNGRRVFSVDEEPDGVMVHLVPLPRPVAQLHSCDYLLPPDVVERMKRLSAERPMRDLHVHVQAIDAADVQRVVSSPAFREAIEKIKRSRSVTIQARREGKTAAMEEAIGRRFVSAFERETLDGSAPGGAAPPRGFLTELARQPNVDRSEYRFVLRIGQPLSEEAIEACKRSWANTVRQQRPAPELARTVTKCRCGTYQYVSPCTGWLDRASGRMHTAERCPAG